MPSRKVKLALPYTTLDAIEGSGSELTFKLRGQRTTKAGTTEFYEIELKVCRWGIKNLLTKLREMHVRDRERIQSELARIDQEANTLKVQA